MENLLARALRIGLTGRTASTFGRVDHAAIYMTMRVWFGLLEAALGIVFALLESRPELWLVPIAAAPTVIDGLRRRGKPNQPVLGALMMDTTAVGVLVTVVGLTSVTVAWGLAMIVAGAVVASARQLRWHYPYVVAWMVASVVVSWRYDITDRWDQGTVVVFATIQLAVTMVAAAALVTTVMRRLRDLQTERNRLIGGFAHDLKNALTGAVGMAELLTTHLDDLDHGEILEYATMTLNQSQEAVAMTEDLLAVERAEARRLEIAAEPVALANIAAQVLAAMGHDSVTELEATGRVTEPLGHADPGKVRQIVRNLISNADRYGGEHLRVTVDEDDTTAYLRVTDSGSPIPEAERDRIFDAYQRARHQKQHSESVGLGLTISRHLARLMDGDLTYRHTDGWSVFELSMPRAVSPEDLVPEARGEVITTGAEQIWLGVDGILRSRIRSGAEIRLEEARAGMDAYRRLRGDIKRPVLVYAEKVGFISSGAREHYTKSDAAASCLSALGLLVDLNPSARFLAGSFARLTNPPFPTRMFDDEREATAWLSQYRQDVRPPPEVKAVC